jgi:hypothetical protein
MADMTVFDLAFAVLAGNLLTIMVVWGVWSLTKAERGEGPERWVHFVAILVPFGFVLLTALTA